MKYVSPENCKSYYRRTGVSILTNLLVMEIKNTDDSTRDDITDLQQRLSIQHTVINFFLFYLPSTMMHVIWFHSVSVENVQALI